MSIKISFDNLRTKQGIENVNSALKLRKSGMFTDEEIQKMYDEQIEKKYINQNEESEKKE